MPNDKILENQTRICNSLNDINKIIDERLISAVEKKTKNKQETISQIELENITIGTIKEKLLNDTPEELIEKISFLIFTNLLDNLENGNKA